VKRVAEHSRSYEPVMTASELSLDSKCYRQTEWQRTHILADHYFLVIKLFQSITF